MKTLARPASFPVFEILVHFVGEFPVNLTGLVNTFSDTQLAKLVHYPGVLKSNAVVRVALLVDRFVDIRTSWNPPACNGPSNYDPAGVQIHPVTSELEVIVIALPSAPRLFGGNKFHALQNVIRNERMAVCVTVATPLFGDGADHLRVGYFHRFLYVPYKR